MYLILDIKNSTMKLTSIIKALDDKQAVTDSLWIKNNTRIDHHEIQVEKLREDYQKLLEKTIVKWKVS